MGAYRALWLVTACFRALKYVGPKRFWRYQKIARRCVRSDGAHGEVRVRAQALQPLAESLLRARYWRFVVVPVVLFVVAASFLLSESEDKVWPGVDSAGLADGAFFVAALFALAGGRSEFELLEALDACGGDRSALSLPLPGLLRALDSNAAYTILNGVAEVAVSLRVVRGPRTLGVGRLVGGAAVILGFLGAAQRILAFALVQELAGRTLAAAVAVPRGNRRRGDDAAMTRTVRGPEAASSLRLDATTATVRQAEAASSRSSVCPAVFVATARTSLGPPEPRGRAVAVPAQVAGTSVVGRADRHKTFEALVHAPELDEQDASKVPFDGAYPPTEWRWSVGPSVAMFVKRKAPALETPQKSSKTGLRLRRDEVDAGTSPRC